MEQSKFHKNFQLNGVSFSNKDEILAYSKTFSLEMFNFFEIWFSDDDNITVKTSGSTGKPKLIKLRKEFMQNSSKATGLFFEAKENTSALLCLPIQYIAGKMMLVRAIVLGWNLDIINSNSNPLENINKHYDFSAMVPLQLENSLSKIHLIKKLIVGGGVVSNTLQDKLKSISTQVFATYGMTETITHIAVKQLNNFITDQGRLNKLSYYQLLPSITIYKDQRNCLVIDAPKISEKIIVTNDVVNLVSDSQFEWLGRFDNVINSGGIKLHPEKIEEKLSKILFHRFFVTGIYDENLGEKLILIIENNNLNKSEKNIINKIRNLKLLSKYEFPKKIYFINKFLETKTGKIQRKKTLDLLRLTN